MNIRLARCVSAVLSGFLLSAPAMAEQPKTAAKAPDPNQVICEKQEVVGSRLAVRRVCMTRAQWADKRLQDRHYTEKMQTDRGLTVTE